MGVIRNPNEDGALLLAAAILLQAKIDYLQALKTNNRRQIHVLERFFLSDWGQEISLMQGELIIAKCQEIYSEWLDRHKRDRMKRNE